jgi:formate-dependent nitrite reductase membrane component NrfD
MTAPDRSRLERHMPQDPEPTGTTDGRNIDLSLGILAGEASGLRSSHPEDAASVTYDVVAHADGDGSPTYHGLPVLKAPVWKAWIPTYFFTGGVAGASALLGAIAQVGGGRALAPIVRPARWIATVGLATSAALLIVDLGRPARFLNMLRVFRPTSPMNVGTWIVSGAGAFSGAAAVLPLVGARRLADAAAIASGAFGLGLATYTGVLVANTAVPAWQDGRRVLPLLFSASAITGAASVLDLVPGLGARPRRAIRIFGILGRVAELAAGGLYTRELRARGEVVSRVLAHGRSGALWHASELLTLASLACSLFGGRSRGARIAGGVLGIAGSLATRFAVMEAGKASARDPRATFEPQRRDREERERAARERAAGQRAPIERPRAPAPAFPSPAAVL